MFNGANTGFMLLAASLVMLMTPGLAFFYGGLVGRSNTLTIMIQSFASMGITTILWWAIGYSLCFNGGSNGVYGNFHLAFLRHVGVQTLYAPSGIPLVVLIAYQMMFAIITPALITGAFTNRVTFKAYLLFLVVWQIAVYYPFVHMFWGNGMLAHWGARDFAGGIVVHASAGWAALASVLYVGKRKFADAPHNIPFIALGTGLLWFGWYGFNAGYVPIYASVVIGIAAGVVCYYAIQLKNHFHWDDALDVWGVHGMGGLLGIVLLGVFAGTAINPAGAQGLVHGSGTFFFKQLAAGAGCSAYAFLFTYVMLRVIDLVTPVRVGAEAEEGLDASMHGESAYALGV